MKKGRKVALIFPKPGWRGNSHILQVYETGVGSLLNWPAEEDHLHSGTGALGSPQGSLAFQQRERKGNSGSKGGNVTVEPGDGRRWNQRQHEFGVGFLLESNYL